MENNKINQPFLINKPSLILRIKSTMIDAVAIIIMMYLVSLVLDSLNIESGMIRGIFLG